MLMIDFFLKIIFNRGVVRVDTSLNFLDINQCSMPYYVPNAFKGSDRCDSQSTVVSKNVIFVENGSIDNVLFIIV